MRAQNFVLINILLMNFTSAGINQNVIIYLYFIKSITSNGSTVHGISHTQWKQKNSRFSHGSSQGKPHSHFHAAWILSMLAKPHTSYISIFVYTFYSDQFISFSLFRFAFIRRCLGELTNTTTRILANVVDSRLNVFI